MTADPTPAVVQCRWCGASHVRMFTDDQARELVDEEARESGGNIALAAKVGVGEKTIRRMRNRIAVESETLMRVDRYYQEHPEWPERLRLRFAYDQQQRQGRPAFSLTMPEAGGRWLIQRRTQKT